MALFYQFFRYPIPYGVQEGLQIVAGVGVGLSLATPILILQAAMPLKEMAAATSAWQLTRALGGSIGLAVFTAILNSDMRSRFEQIPGYGTEFNVPTSAAGYRALADLPEGETKTAVLGAFSDALGLCWIINAGFFFACLVVCLLPSILPLLPSTSSLPPADLIAHPLILAFEDWRTQTSARRNRRQGREQGRRGRCRGG